jgi:hypothetical protein
MEKKLFEELVPPGAVVACSEARDKFVWQAVGQKKRDGRLFSIQPPAAR